jgi:3-hydroxyisobutyrate dehydrogenase-like beta-hydroxyacid dehydrogenase
MGFDEIGRKCALMVVSLNDISDRITAAAAILLKDLTLVDELARSVDARTPLARGARDVFAEAATNGLGALNDSEIIRLFRA